MTTTTVSGGASLVVITGLGVVSPIGASRQQFWEGLAEGRQGIRALTVLEGGWTNCKVAGQVIDLPLPVKGDSTEFPISARSLRFAVCAATEALAQSGLLGAGVDLDRVGVVIGTCQGTLLELAPGEAEAAPVDAVHVVADVLARRFGFGGARVTVGNACAAGTNALGLAADKIRTGELVAVLVGGADGLAFPTMAGFAATHSLDDAPCAPYGRSSGLTLGEGAAFFVLEDADEAESRDAEPLAEFLGYGLSADAYHPTAPDPRGRGAQLAMERALEDAALGAEDVDYVNGHGTGTTPNDTMERRAFAQLFGDRSERVPVSSTKSMVGHALGAAGALEAAACIFALDTQTLPPTLGDPRDDAFDFVPHPGRRARIQVAMSNSYAFGGSNASLLLGQPGTAPRPMPQPSGTAEVVVTAVGCVGALGVGYAEWRRALGDGAAAVGPIRAFDPSPYRSQVAAECPDVSRCRVAPPGLWRRMDRFARMCMVASRQAWDAAALGADATQREHIGLVFGTGTGSFETTEAFYRDSYAGPDKASPFSFPNIVLNAPAGHVASALGIRGPTSTIAAGGTSGLLALGYALDLIRLGRAETCIVLTADDFCEGLHRALDRPGNVLTPGEPRPFDHAADGCALGSAAVALVVESAPTALRRGVSPVARVLSVASAGDPRAHGSLGSDEALERAVRRALGEASVASPEVAYVASAASGVREHDIREAVALGRLFTHSVCVGAPKSMTGECSGTSGLINVLACLAAVSEGVLAPCVGLRIPAGPGHLTYLVAPERGVPVDHALATASAFNGSHSAALVGAPHVPGAARGPSAGP